MADILIFIYVKYGIKVFHQCAQYLEDQLIYGCPTLFLRTFIYHICAYNQS